MKTIERQRWRGCGNLRTRRWLRLAAFLLLVAGSTCPGKAVEPDRSSTPSILWQNEDLQAVFQQAARPGEAATALNRYIDVLADGGVGTVVFNIFGQRAIYSGQVVETFWDGYDPQGPDEQAFLAAIPSSRERTAYRQLLDNMLRFNREIGDMPSNVIARCRQRGLSPWLSLRMNDTHNNDVENHPIHNSLWKLHPEWRRTLRQPGAFLPSLDYAQAAVRAFYGALIQEVLQRYDCDGLELDFMRDPWLFSAGQEKQGAASLTAWLGTVRAGVEQVARQRGHPVKLAVRIPAHPETAAGFGMDVSAWAQQKLIDVVVASSGSFNIDYEIPFATWRALLGHQVLLLGGLEVTYVPSWKSSGGVFSPEQAIGGAVATVFRGGDGVYLFNYFQQQSPRWPLAVYRETLRTMSSRNRLLDVARCHCVAPRNCVAPGEKYNAPLPLKSVQPAFDIPVGPKPAADWSCDVVVELTGAPGKDRPPPTLRLNGVTARHLGVEANLLRPYGLCNRTLTYTLPAGALAADGQARIELVSDTAEPLEVDRMEVYLYPPGGRLSYERARAFERLCAFVKRTAPREAESLLTGLTPFSAATDFVPVVNVLMKEDRWSRLWQDEALALDYFCGSNACDLLLVVLEQHPVPDVRVLAASVLATRKNPRVNAALVESAMQCTNLTLQLIAIKALGVQQEKPAVPVLLSILAGADSADVRVSTLEALGAIGDERAAGGLLRILQGDTNMQVRACAAEALGRARLGLAEKELIEALRVSNSAVREHAARALGMIGNPEATSPLANLLLKGESETEWTRVACARALGQLNDPQAVAALEQALQSETSINVRQSLAWALTALKHKP